MLHKNTLTSLLNSGFSLFILMVYLMALLLLSQKNQKKEITPVIPN